MRPIYTTCIVLFALGLTSTASAVQTSEGHPTLATEGERSAYVRTGRYDEVITLCARFAASYPKRVRCIDFGVTPEGRPMKALVANNAGVLDAASARSQGIPVVFVQGGIHAGEIDGKDAGFLALREVLEGKAARTALDRQVLVFVPVFNVDGHERFRAWNRPNQNGPAEMGWRVTARNFNLNRDYAKADSTEMQAMLRLVDEWDPLLVVDLHVTDGAKFEHDIAIQVEPVHAGDDALRRAGRALRDNVIATLRKQGSQPLPFYPSFVKDDDPSSGFTDGVAPPRFSTGYFHLRNRFSMLVETHAWKDYPTRVRITRNTVIAVLDQVANHGSSWQRLAQQADARSSMLGGSEVPLDYIASDKSRIIDFRGFVYTRTPSDVSGALMTRYDDTRPQIWKIPLRDHILPGKTATAPKGGYWVSAAYAAMVADKLSLHGIKFHRIAERREGLAVDALRAEKITFDDASIESHQRLVIEGRWQPERQSLAPGALFVPIAQPKAALIMALLEPQAPDSLLAWGFFNNAFERKEYMEDYVAEQVARELMAADATVRTDFERKLRENSAFAADPQARLEFFYRKHNAWDERYGLYPVFRTDTDAF